MKKLDTAKRLIKRFNEDLKEFSFKVALGRFVRDMPFISWRDRYKYYQTQIRDYLFNQFSETLKELLTTYNPYEEHEGEKTIWVMWWQGEDSMPPIVSACYSQLQKVKEDFSIVLISKYNYSNYIKLPQNIIDKVENGSITLTHLSDIIRWGLLYEYGGLYLDIKIYVSKLPEQLRTESFYTARAPGIWQDTFYDGRWAGFYLYFRNAKSLFSWCMFFLFINYWKDHNKLVDYFLIDYFIDLIYSNIPEIKRTVDNVESNYSFQLLQENLNKEYNEQQFREICQKSNWHLLTWKKEFNLLTIDDKLTFYGHILKSAESQE